MHILMTLLVAARVAVPSPATTDLRGEPLMAALKQGGYTVVLRHARTDRSFQEAMGYVPASRAQQRNLNDDGVRDARLMGVVFKKYGIPFGEIISSPMYRTMETAEYAAGPATSTMVLRTVPSPEAAKQLIAVAPKPGTNRLIVTHHFVIETWVPGIQPGDIGESEAAVVRTAKDGSIELVGKILLADWRELAGEAAAAPAAAPAHHNVTTVPFPHTKLGFLALDYARVFSTGDSTEMRKYLESFLEVDPARSTADRLASYGKLFETLGALHVIGAEAVSDDEITLAAHGKPGVVRLVVRRSQTQEGRAASITFRYGAHP